MARHLTFTQNWDHRRDSTRALTAYEAGWSGLVPEGAAKEAIEAGVAVETAKPAEAAADARVSGEKHARR